MSKVIPIEGSRLAGTGLVKWAWKLPWACHGCRRYGDIDVNVAMVGRSTSDEVDEKIDRAHHATSPLCISRRFQRGEIVYRIKNGTEKIYLAKPGQDPEDVKGEPWPPWTE